MKDEVLTCNPAVSCQTFQWIAVP